MKKMKMLGIMTLTVLALSGCQGPSDREAALEDQVAQLEQQVTSLERAQNEEIPTESSAEETTFEAESTKEKNPQNSNSVSFSDDNLDSLTTVVNNIIKKVDKLASSGSSSQQDFFNLQDEFHEVEYRLEAHEEQIESDLRQGNLSHDEARKTEYELEKLEDRLDNAEDKLEYAFGYDD